MWGCGRLRNTPPLFRCGSPAFMAPPGSFFKSNFPCTRVVFFKFSHMCDGVFPFFSFPPLPDPFRFFTKSDVQSFALHCAAVTPRKNGPLFFPVPLPFPFWQLDVFPGRLSVELVDNHPPLTSFQALVTS